MAERKAVNKYYPPEWEPKHGSINKFRGQHPLRDRARKLSQGILIIRFEMPYNVWCEGCGSHIGKGVRYNAEKKQVGKYFSTKIWSFRMKCHLCPNWMEVQTDPEHRDYVMVSGVKRKEETWDENEEVGEGQSDSEEKNENANKEEIKSDPFAKLEHKNSDIKKAERVKPELEQLYEKQDRLYDDFGASQALRSKFRTEKKELQHLDEEANDLGLSIKLLPKVETDQEKAKEVFSTKITTTAQKKEKSVKDRLKSTPIFANSSAYKISPTSSVKGRKSERSAF